MASLIVLVDATIPVAADFNTNFTNLNSEVRPTTTGGTGVSAYTLGDLLYASATNMLARRAIGTEGQTLQVSAGVPAWGSAAGSLNGIAGLTLSNNSGDAVNDLDIAAGAAQSDDATIANRVLLTLTSALTKRLDATWAVGTNQGGLDTGSVGNNTYHVFLIMRPDTAVVDVLFSLSATAPTMPTNYTKKRRIGSIVRLGGTILAFNQAGDEFLLLAPVLDVDTTTLSTTAVVSALTVPTGVKVHAILNVFTTAGANNSVLLSEMDVTDAAPSTTVAPLSTHHVPSGGHSDRVRMRTNTSAQIRARSSAGSTTLRIATAGWVDRRGRDD